MPFFPLLRIPNNEVLSCLSYVCWTKYKQPTLIKIAERKIPLFMVRSVQFMDVILLLFFGECTALYEHQCYNFL